jgi:apolipoprotein N-acyltransferase
MIAVPCLFASAVCFYFSTDLGALWPLAWIAPLPVLWLAFGKTRGWTVFFAAWAASMLGGLNLLPAYFGSLPVLVLIVAIVLPALAFAASVMGARLVAQRTTPLAGVFAFAALWTAWDYLASLGANGAALSPAYSQVGAPYLIQGASMFGLWIVTFLIGFVSAGLAMSLATRRALPAALAALLFAANAGYGAWRIVEAPRTQLLHVGLAVDDSLASASFRADEKTALDAVSAYAAAVRSLAAQGATLIVFPEKLAVLEPAWRGAALAELETAAHVTHTTIVIGFDDRGTERQNNALIFFANGSPPALYTKRRLVPGLEDGFVPGHSSFMLANRTSVAICKDMDFPAMLRSDAALHPTLFAVPAWDFDQDRWWHARLAIMRGVEDGFAVARAAKDGLLTLTDAYGRVMAMKRSEAGGMVTLVGDLRRGPGKTLYASIGDAFAWACLALGLLLFGWALRAPKPG